MVSAPNALPTLAALPMRRGKVRDIHDLGDRLLFVATDRISAYDWVLPNAIPDKGRVLNGLSAFWFEWLSVPHHVISLDFRDTGLPFTPEERDWLDGRCMIVAKAKVVLFECVVRGYLAGSGWRSYRKEGTICGVSLPAGLIESDRLPEPIFTPATKSDSGHDENVPFDRMIQDLGREEAETLRDRSLDVYRRAAAYAESRGLILADTKFEWGRDESTGELLLIDEVLTPDSSRYWSAEHHVPGGAPPSFDKQFVRDWLDETNWDKSSPPPELPVDVIARTRAKYIDAYEILTGQAFPWARRCCAT